MMQQQWARFEIDLVNVVPLDVRHVMKCQETHIAENSASQVKAADSSSSPRNLNNEKPQEPEFTRWVEAYDVLDQTAETTPPTPHDQGELYDRLPMDEQPTIAAR
ncbi:hypothetical protein AOLI_G00076220 [Acnodon oligacanthus]